MDEDSRAHYNKIRSLEVFKKGKKKSINVEKVDALRLVFGPHFFITLAKENDELYFYFGATHHGFKVKANEVNGNLENIIKEARKENVNIERIP